MTRLPATFALAILAGLPGCSSGASVAGGPKAGFHFEPGAKVRMSMKSDFDFKERALGMDRDGLYMSGRLAFDVEIEIVSAGAAGFTGRLTPRSFDYASGEDELVYKDGKLTRSEAAEKDGLDLPMKPYDLRLLDDGTIADVRPDQGPAGFMFAGAVLSHPPCLLGWLGILPAVELRDGMDWNSSPSVMLARSDAIPLKIVATSIKKVADGWSVGLLLGVDKTSGKYEWLKTCVETGTGSVEFDAKGRPVRAAVSWEAKTGDGKPIGEYQWTCDFSR